MYKLLESEIPEKKLSQWIIKGDLEKIKAYFKANPSEIKNKLPDNKDLVTFAIEKNQEKIFDWLLSNGAKAEANNNGFTPLHQAALSPNPYYVGKLVKFGLDINVTDKKSQTPLGNVITYVSDINTKQIEKTRKSEELKDTFRELINYGADMHVSKAEGYGSNYGAFMQAVKNGLTPFVKLMIDKDKSLLKQEYMDYTIISIAMLYFQNDVLKLLIDEDIEVNFIEVKNYIFIEVKNYIHNTDDTDLAMRFYELLSESLKSQLQIEKMLHNVGGKEKLLRLLERGVKITDEFVKDTRVREIADELINSSRGTEIAALGVKNGITDFLPQTAKDVFLF